MEYISFQKAIKELGFDPQSLILEYFLSVANNNVIGLKYKDITWAVSSSFPKTKDITENKLKKFIRLQKICAFLTDRFKKGIKIDENTVFIFDGNCFLCDNNSTKGFIKKLGEKQKFKVSPKIFDYQGPFLVKKGAPASETLEYDIDFKTIMLQGFAILHKHTGVSELVDKNLAFKITKEIISKLDINIRSLKPSDRLKKDLEKYNARWNKDENEEVERHIIRETLIRSERFFEKLVNRYILKYKIDSERHKCFIHGDAHGGNFIVVQRGDKKEVHLIDVEDALGLSDGEKRHYLFDLIKFTISAYNLSRIFKKPLEVEELMDIYYKYFDFVKV